MKTTILSMIAIGALVASSLSGLTSGIQADDELQQANTVHLASPIAAVQESGLTTPTALQDPPPPPADSSPSDVPMEHSAVVQWDSSQPVFAPGAMCCSCCRRVCCCEVPTTLCLVDPCDGCSYEACVHLPPCCAGTAPVIEWNNGILGRKIIWLCWPCCDKQIKVVVPVFGDVRVWE